MPASSAQARCPLCANIQVRELEHIDASELAAAYRRDLGIAVAFPTAQIQLLVCEPCDLRFFLPSCTGDELFYQELQEIPWYYSADKQEFHIAAGYLSPRDAILEIGAGRGLFAAAIRATSYTGLEFSPTAIALAAANGVHLFAETIESHAQRNPDRYDVVCSFQVLEHVADPAVFIGAGVRCLRPGGRLIVSVPGEDSFAGFDYLDVLNLPPHHVTRWTDACLCGLARHFGLTLLALRPEPLSRAMRRAYATVMVQRFVCGLLGQRPRLLDPVLRRPMISALTKIGSHVVKRYLSLTPMKARRGHAVVAVFEKPMSATTTNL